MLGSPPKGCGRPGFTFIEVMFALVILAFGVIMVAAMLPVAVRQTQNTRETNAGSAIIESGFHQLETLWGSYDAIGRGPTFLGALPATNRLSTADRDFVVTFPAWGWYDGWNNGSADTDGDGLNDAIETFAGTDINDASLYPVIGLFAQSGGNRIESSTARDAWIPFYTRSGTLPPMMSLVGVRARNVDSFPQAYFTLNDNAPLPVSFELPANYEESSGGYLATNSRGGVDHLEPTPVTLGVPSTLSTPSPTADQIAEAAVEGAVLVVINRNGQIRMLTLSNPVEGGSLLEWELAPGGDVRVNVNPSGTPAFVAEFEQGVEYRGYLVGRMLKDPFAAWDPEANPYVGPTQVVQVLEGKMLR